MLALAACASTSLASGVSVAPSGIAKINHVVVIYQENWSFDGLYGRFPGANGIANAGEAATQRDRDGMPYRVLPPVYDVDEKRIDPRFPRDLPNRPFDLATYVNPSEKTGDLIHRFYQNQRQIDGGRNDRFVAWSDAGALTMSYYDATSFPEGRLAREFTLLDNFFQGAFGGSFLNHMWLACACTPKWDSAPSRERAVLDEQGNLVKDGAVTPDGFVVNTSYSMNTPRPPFAIDTRRLMPPITAPTLGDRLTAKGLSWAWYAAGWNEALAGKGDTFEFHHQPYLYFNNFRAGTEGRTHLKDETDFLRDVAHGTLPAVAFVKPGGLEDEHPGSGDVLSGQEHVAKLVAALRASRDWSDMAIIITYDENGGRWDHVAPPVVDRWGPGSRVPAVIVSPYARRGHVDHTLYDTTSILRFIERRWNLQPLGERDAHANDLTNAFDFR